MNNPGIVRSALHECSAGTRQSFEILVSDLSRFHAALVLIANPRLPRENGESDRDIAFKALND